MKYRWGLRSENQGLNFLMDLFLKGSDQAH